MKKFFGVAIAVVLLASVTFAAPAAKTKATGDIDFINGPGPGGYNQQANLTFNAINTGSGLGAKGSAIYTDANITYAMDVQYLQVDGNKAWFAGKVTSVTDDAICCKVGNWMFFMVQDNGEPGINDLVWGEDLTNDGKVPAGDDAAGYVAQKRDPQYSHFVVNGGNLQVR